MASPVLPNTCLCSCSSILISLFCSAILLAYVCASLTKLSVKLELSASTSILSLIASSISISVLISFIFSYDKPSSSCLWLSPLFSPDTRFNEIRGIPRTFILFRNSYYVLKRFYSFLSFRLSSTTFRKLPSFCF